MGLPAQQLAALSDSDDDLDILLLHVSADVSAAPATGRHGEACDGQDLIAWLDDVVKGVNALHGARDGLLLVLLLAAVRCHPSLPSRGVACQDPSVVCARTGVTCLGVLDRMYIAVPSPMVDLIPHACSS